MSNAKPSQPRFSFRKRAVFSLLLLILVVFMVELVAAAGLALFSHYPNTSAIYLQQENLAERPLEDQSSPHVIHPYIGWVHDPFHSKGESG